MARFWQADEQRTGRAARLSDETVDSVEEVLTVVATGREIALTHKSTGGSMPARGCAIRASGSRGW